MPHTQVTTAVSIGGGFNAKAQLLPETSMAPVGCQDHSSLQTIMQPLCQKEYERRKGWRRQSQTFLSLPGLLSRGGGGSSRRPPLPPKVHDSPLRDCTRG